MYHRVFQAAAWLAVVLFVALPARAGSYLDRAALLVQQARDESTYLRKHLSDVELARLIHGICLGRVEAAREMLVPKEIQLAHPHIVLMLESYERASAAATKGSAGDFLNFTRRAQDEEQVFRGIIIQSGWELPTAK